MPVPLTSTIYRRYASIGLVILWLAGLGVFVLKRLLGWIPVSSPVMRLLLAHILFAGIRRNIGRVNILLRHAVIPLLAQLGESKNKC